MIGHEQHIDTVDQSHPFDAPHQPIDNCIVRTENRWNLRELFYTSVRPQQLIISDRVEFT